MPSSSATASASPSGSKRSASSSSSSKKKREGELSAIEKRVYQAIYGNVNHTMMSPEYGERFAEIAGDERLKIINSLSRKSLLTFQKLSSGELRFVAVSKKEASVMGQLDDDEAIVYAHIRDTKNEGLWQAILKKRSNLHQTVMMRALKGLAGKSLIKEVKSVKYPTRKTYMLKELQPSVELSGGPWYTDNELDTAFIEQLCHMLDIYICQMTWPESQGQRKRPTTPQPVLLASCTPQLPNARACLRWLKSKNVTETILQVQDVQDLLAVLVYDGKIEKIPQYGMSSNGASKTKGRRRGSHDEYDDKGHKDGYETVSDESEIEVGSRSSSKRKSKRHSKGGETETDVSDSEDERRKRKSKSGARSSKSRGSSSKSKKRHRDDKSSEESDDASDSSSGRDRKRKSIRLSSYDSSSSSDEQSDADDAGASTDNYVYRAVRPYMTQAGWTEVPCAHCPVMSFCQPGGPINAESCIYMRDWLVRTKKRDEEDREGLLQEHERQGNGHIAMDNEAGAEDVGDASLGYDYAEGDDAIDEANGNEEYDDYGGEEV